MTSTASIKCSITNGSVNSSTANMASSIQNIVNAYILPTELFLGFVGQLLSLLVLRRKRMKALRYAIYLKALSITYLLSCVVLLPTILHKNAVFDATNYTLMYYYAHFEQYLINALLYSANLLIVALSIDPLRALMSPFDSMLSRHSERKHYYIMAGHMICFLLVTPVGLMKYVSVANEINGRIEYCVAADRSTYLGTLRYINAAIFEIGVSVCVVIVHVLLFLRYAQVRRTHVQKTVVRLLHQGRNMRNSAQRHHRATMLCLGSTVAFLVCNLPSASIECYFLYFQITRQPIGKFYYSRTGIIWKNAANCALVFNFALNFFMQCIFCRQYRQEIICMLFPWFDFYASGVFEQTTHFGRSNQSTIASKKTSFFPASSSAKTEKALIRSDSSAKQSVIDLITNMAVQGDQSPANQIAANESAANQPGTIQRIPTSAFNQSEADFTNHNVIANGGPAHQGCNEQTPYDNQPLINEEQEVLQPHAEQTLHHLSGTPLNEHQTPSWTLHELYTLYSPQLKATVIPSSSEVLWEDLEEVEFTRGTEV